MRPLLRAARRAAFVLIGLPSLLVLLVLIVGNTGPGRTLFASLTQQATGGTVILTRLAGRFPDQLHVGRMELRDGTGIWLQVDDAALDWSPLHLLRGRLEIDRIAAGRLEIIRFPSGSGDERGGETPAIPLRLHQLRIDQLVIHPPQGPEAILRATGHARFNGREGAIELSLTDDMSGRYQLSTTLEADTVGAELTITEAANGTLARLARLPGLGAIDARASLRGPLQALRVSLSARAGPADVTAHGTLDTAGAGTHLEITAQTPAMAPAPDLSWSGLRANATVEGRLRAPTVDAALTIDAPAIAGASASRLSATARGTAGHIVMDLRADTPRLPGGKPDVLGPAPLLTHADLRMDMPGAPIEFQITHPLLKAAATVRTETAGKARSFRTQGTLDLSTSAAPLPALIGEGGRFAGVVRQEDHTIVVSELRLEGAQASLSARGDASPQRLDLAWNLDLTDLSALAPQLRGHLAAKGRLSGTPNDASLEADLTGVVSAEGITEVPGGPPEKLTAHLRVAHLPHAPAATLVAVGGLAGAPLTIDLTAMRGTDGALRLDVVRAQWRSAHLAGALTLPAGASLPDGRLEGGMAKLDDFSPLLGRPLAGSLDFAIAGGPASVTLKAEATATEIPGIGRARRAWVDGTITDPTTTPQIAGELGIEAAAAGNVSGSAQLSLHGTPDALRARLATENVSLAGSPIQLGAMAELDLENRRIVLSSLDAGWRDEKLRLLAPARITLRDTTRIERLRLGLRDAELDAAGQLAPRLDLTARLRNVSLDLLRMIAPGMAAEGTLSADATLGGTLAAPTGHITAQVTKYRARTGTARALPPANLTATAILSGSAAQVNLRLDAGRAATLALTGQTPLRAGGTADLKLKGDIDLVLLDPLLTPAGRRARGHVRIDAALAGAIANPRASGSITLANAELQDAGLGARLDRIGGRAVFDGTALRIERLRARAGSGNLGLTGSIGVLAPGMPVDLHLTARNARVLSGDQLNTLLDANLTLRGNATETLAAAGDVNVREASVRVPEHLPGNIATLDVRRPGAPQPTAEKTPLPDISLDVSVAGRQMTVRGRGIDAEFAGKMHLRGSVTTPRPDGSFKLRRGAFTLAGRTLDFSKGEIGFTGGALNDPSLDLMASSPSGGITAMIVVTGTARKPQFKLTSSPSLPQDEVLARLLFNRSASSLSPVELAQIAATLASLSGIESSVTDPLEGVRDGLGLDRLSVSTDPQGNPTLNAGRYVAPGVYVGVKQNGTAGGTQGSVQIDLMDALKLDGTFGTSDGTTGGGTAAQSTGSGVGLTYQVEY